MAQGQKKTTINKDNRLAVRVPVQLLVDYRADGSYLFDFCRDLGTGGVFIETDSALPAGTEMELTFTIPDSKETLKTKGTVLWVQGKVDGRPDLHAGMGIQFSNFSAEQRKLLEDFVRRHNANVIPEATNGKQQSA